MSVNAFDALAATQSVLKEQVQDSFGASIDTNVLEPMLSEASGLMRLTEEAERELREIDSILEEARSIVGQR